MAFDPYTATVELIKTGLEKWLPDANARTQAASELATQVNAQLMGQIQLNLQEAQSNSFFISGWRPAIGWMCFVAYCWQYIILPFCIFVLTAVQVHMDIAQLPKLDMAELGFLLLSMLGIGTLRTIEKSRGVT